MKCSILKKTGEDTHSVPQYVGKHVLLINQGANVLGHVRHSLISN